MYICTCVRTYICMYVCMYVQLSVCLSVCLSVTAERKTSLGYDWHPQCLKCEMCEKTLQPGRHSEVRSVCVLVCVCACVCRTDGAEPIWHRPFAVV